MRIISLFFFVTYIFAAGCKKSPESQEPATSITYTITDGDESIANITFRDANGEIKTLDNYADFGGAEKTIKVREKPFEAFIKIIVNNTTTSQKSYVLAISVEGEPQNYKGLLVPQNSSGYESELKFVVQ